MPKCRCGGIGRRPGLKIPWENIPYRFDPGHRHQFHIAEWSNPVARRAHNPKVVGSNPASATKTKRKRCECISFFLFLLRKTMTNLSFAGANDKVDG